MTTKSELATIRSKGIPSVRHIHMVSLLPRHPNFLTTTQIVKKLNAEGFIVSKRTVERDLAKLTAPLFLKSVESPEGNKWSRSQHSVDISSPPATVALLLMMTQKYLLPSLPPSSQKELSQSIESASKFFEEEELLGNWIHKVKITTKSIPLIAPELDEAIQSTVYQAVLKEEQIKITYRKNSGDINNYTLNPWGLILADHIYYLIASKTESPDTLQNFKLDQIQACAEHFMDNQPCSKTLNEHIAASETSYLIQPGAINISMKVAGPAHILLRDRKISENQIFKPLEPVNNLPIARVTATTQLTYDLVNFLVGYGKWVQVDAPQVLIDKINERKFGDMFGV